jgi:WD40 repeat protein
VVWDIDTRQPIAFFSSEHMPGFLDNSWSPDGNRIATIARADPYVTLWNPENGETVTTFDAHAPSSVAWNPDSARIAVGGDSVTIWDSLTGELLSTFAIGPIGKIAWSPDGDKLAGVDPDYNIRIFDASTGAPLKTLRGHTSAVERIVWHPNGATLASADREGAVYIWETATGDALDILQYTGAVFALDWSPDGKQLAYGGVSDDGQDALLEIIEPALATFPTATSTPSNVG